MVAALKAGQKVSTIEIGGRGKWAAKDHFHRARENGLGIPALREYVEKTCPEYVYKPKQVLEPWSVEEDQTLIQARKEGKTFKEIAAMLPGRTEIAVGARWCLAKSGNAGTAALREYAAECAPEKRPWSVEEDQTFIQAHWEGKTFHEIAAMLPRRTEGAVRFRWHEARLRKKGTAALRESAAECIPSESPSPWSVEEDQTFIQAHWEGKAFKEIAAMLPRRTHDAVKSRWNVAKSGKAGAALLLAYIAKLTLSESPSPWSVEEDQTFIRAHKEGKAFKEIAAMLPRRTEGAVKSRGNVAKSGKAGTAALRGYGAENN